MANTFKFGNGNWATKEDSVLAYNDENNNFKPLPFDFTRASTATYVDSDGLIKTAGNGEARIDYTDSTDGALLLEPARSNSINYSKDFSSWTQADTSTVSIADSFDGSNNAYKVSITGGTGFQTIRKTGLSISGVQTFTIYAKKDTLNFIRILFGGFGNFWVDLQNGTQGTTTGSFDNITITNAGNGFFKIVAIFTPSTATTHVYFYPSTANADVIQTSGSIILQYAQLEQGSYATSYIPTSGSAVTRVADVCEGAGNSEVFNDSEGVLYAEISALANDGTIRYLGLNDGGTGNRVIILYHSDNNNIRAIISSGGTKYVDVNSSVSSSLDFHKVAIKYKLNDSALWIDGVQVATDTTLNAPIGLDRLDFYLAGSGDFYGKCKDLKVYNTTLTDAELETLTT